MGHDLFFHCINGEKHSEGNTNFACEPRLQSRLLSGITGHYDTERVMTRLPVEPKLRQRGMTGNFIANKMHAKFATEKELITIFNGGNK